MLTCKLASNFCCYCGEMGHLRNRWRHVPMDQPFGNNIRAAWAFPALCWQLVIVLWRLMSHVRGMMLCMKLQQLTDMAGTNEIPSQQLQWRQFGWFHLKATILKLNEILHLPKLGIGTALFSLKISTNPPYLGTKTSFYHGIFIFIYQYIDFSVSVISGWISLLYVLCWENKNSVSILSCSFTKFPVLPDQY